VRERGHAAVFAARFDGRAGVSAILVVVVVVALICISIVYVTMHANLQCISIVYVVGAVFFS